MSEEKNKGCKGAGSPPLEEPNIVFLADKAHRVRGLARQHFALANEKTQELKWGRTTVKAEQIKRRLGWSLSQGTKGTYCES
jgi:hypothetical protein